MQPAIALGCGTRSVVAVDYSVYWKKIYLEVVVAEMLSNLVFFNNAFELDRDDSDKEDVVEVDRSVTSTESKTVGWLTSNNMLQHLMEHEKVVLHHCPCVPVLMISTRKPWRIR